MGAYRAASALAAFPLAVVLNATGTFCESRNSSAIMDEPRATKRSNVCPHKLSVAMKDISCSAIAAVEYRIRLDTLFWFWIRSERLATERTQQEGHAQLKVIHSFFLFSCSSSIIIDYCEIIITTTQQNVNVVQSSIIVVDSN